MTGGKLGDYLPGNLADWERTADWYERRHARALRKYRGKAWGLFRIPEQRLRLLGEVRGNDVLELGCGAASWSIALTRDGANVVGLDFSPARLAQARQSMKRARLEFPLVEARADRIPFPDRHFDLVLSDYGATTFSDPRRTIPEVARVLKAGGALVFAHASPFRSVAQEWKTGQLRRRFVRGYFETERLRFGASTEFQLGYAEWFRLFSASGLVVERLEEPRAPTRGQSSYLSASDQAWARRWPVESIWKVRRRELPRNRGGPEVR
jgi:ubiquinone/menaquinone biosynthesis C-methylase UbiE